MKDYLNEINDKFPIRRSDKHKQSFFDYVKGELGEGRVFKETLEKKHNNIVIDDISSADLIFTAHYDTPAASVIPNFMMPKNKILGTLINIIFPILMSFICIGAAFLIGCIAKLDTPAIAGIYLIFYLGLFYCLTRLFDNKHNKNDNTSGVATVISISNQVKYNRVAFVLFDNEEKGLLGSKALNKKYKAEVENKLVINLDCVGNGDNIVFIPKDKAEAREEYALLKDIACDIDEYKIHFVPFKKACGNSDHKSFPCSIGVMAGNKGKIAKIFTGRIHTSRDTVASEKNIYFLTDVMVKMIEKRQT